MICKEIDIRAASSVSGCGVEVPLAKHGKTGAIVGNLVDLVSDGRFVGEGHHHLGIDLSGKIICESIALKLCKKGIKSATQIAVGRGLFAKSANQRQGSGDSGAATQYLTPERNSSRKTRRSRRSEQDDGKLERPVPANKSGLLHVVIKRRAQEFEAQLVHVLGGFTPGGCPRVVSIGGLSDGFGRGGGVGLGGLLAHLIAPISNMPPVKLWFMGGMAGRAAQSCGLHQILEETGVTINCSAFQGGNS